MELQAPGRVSAPAGGRPARRPPAARRSPADGPRRRGAWRAGGPPRNRRSGRPCLRAPAPDHRPRRPGRVRSSRRTSRGRTRRPGRTASGSRSPSPASRDPAGGVHPRRPTHPRFAPGASPPGRRRTNNRREAMESDRALHVPIQVPWRKIEARLQRPVPGSLHGFPRKSGRRRLWSCWLPAPGPTVPFPGPHQGKSRKWPGQPSQRPGRGRQGSRDFFWK